MPGSKIGGQKAAATNKAKYGEDFYKRIGAEGGKNGRTGGFYANRELAKIAGARGGKISRRGPNPNSARSLKKREDSLQVLEPILVEIPQQPQKENIVSKFFLRRFRNAGK